MLISYCSKNGIYNRLHYKCGGLVMRDFLINFFEESDVDLGLPQYGAISGQVIALHSPSVFDFELEVDQLPIDIAADDTERIRVFKPKRPIELTFGSPDIEELLLALEENLDDQLLNSPAALLVHYMKSKRSVFFLVEGLTRIALLGFLIASVYIRQQWAYITALVLLLPLALYEAFTVEETLALQLHNPENILDLTLLALSLANSAVGLATGSNVMLEHLTVLTLYMRVVFSLRFIEPVRKFLEVMVNIAIGIVPFFSILIIFTLFASLDGFLVVNSADPTFEGEFIETMDGIYNGQVATEYLADLGTLDRITKWMIIMSRQIMLNLFFLNGILVGIVSNIYGDGEAKGSLIGFRKIISSMR